MDPISFARHLRQNQSSAEDLFWREVRGRRFCGLKFRRQVPIEGYFADFLCEHENLIVELDGFQHDDAAAYDDERTRVLQAHGYRIWRVRNEDIYADIGQVMHDMKLFLGQV